MLKSEIQEQSIVLSAMREQLAAVPPRPRNRGGPGNWGGLHAIEAGSEADATLERSFAIRLTEDLRTELQAVRQELAAQQLHGRGITTRTEVLEEELRTLRAELRGDHGHQSELLLGQCPPSLTATRAMPVDGGISNGRRAPSAGRSACGPEVSRSSDSSSSERILRIQLQELNAVDTKPLVVGEEVNESVRMSDPSGGVSNIGATRLWKGRETEVASLRATNAALRQRLANMERPVVHK